MQGDTQNIIFDAWDETSSKSPGQHPDQGFRKQFPVYVETSISDAAHLGCFGKGNWDLEIKYNEN